MKIVCSYCGKDLGEKEPIDDKNTSHGICLDCIPKVEKEIEDYFAEKELDNSG